MKYYQVAVAVVFFIAALQGCDAARSSKKTKRVESSTGSYHLNKKLTGKRIKSTAPLPPAILAIEIVDPKDETKSSKNIKRTIDSALGYGYQKYSPPRFQVYKYSQDIPPYHGPSPHFHNGIKSHQYDIQKSIAYELPTIKTTEYNNNQYSGGSLSQYYRPGTTLYSTLNNQGHFGGLSASLPQQNHQQQQSYNAAEPQVPVIILKVYPSQLTQPGALHANLPQSHPLAAMINQLDIQSLLAKYVQSSLVQGQQYQKPEQQYHQQQPAEEYGPPQAEPDYADYQQEQPQHQYVQQEQYQQYQPQEEQHQQEEDLLTHENYPKETHTRVVFRTDKNKQGVTPNDAKEAPHQSYVQVQLPEMQYTYADDGNGGGGQVYFYHGEQQQQQNYQQPEAEVQYQQEQVPQPVYNYHSHQKRSKKRSHRTTDDDLVLEPIAA